MAHYVPMDGFTKGKRQKRKKDPNAPKRPQTAFFVFSAKVLDYYYSVPVFNFLLQFRAEVKNELGEGSRVGDVAKELGKRWKQMTDVSTYFLMLNRFGGLNLGQFSGGQEGVQRRGGSTKGRL